MERSIASLTYKGSISDAIVEAQKQKKIFLVYISGEDENSTHLEQSTWLDSNVAESVSRYCIFLHLMQGSIDALQFSAIYPQKSIPSITAVGYNGMMFWQHEGYISAEDFVKGIEKGWAALHFQETAVTLLTAALASKKPEPVDASPPDVAQGSSSAMDVASTSAGKSMKYLDDESVKDTKVQPDQLVAKPTEDKDIGSSLEACSQSASSNSVKIRGVDQTISAESTKAEGLHTLTGDVHNLSTSDNIDVLSAVRETLAVDQNFSEASLVSHAKETVTATEESSKPGAVAEKTDCSNITKTDDIHLSIRLPNGSSLQRKFTMTDTLRSVKNYVDENQSSGVGSYNIAVPYPRKVFSEQDMTSFLSELGFAGRQALIVVPHRQAFKPQKVVSSSRDSQATSSTINPTDDNGGGFFAIAKRALSYLNPLSYLGSNANSSNSESAPSGSLDQYRSVRAFQGDQFGGTEASSQSFSLNLHNPSAAGDGAGNGTRRRTSRPFGSNIHTLRHDEDDFESRDRNTFWNGNSTEFGGDDKK